MKDPGSSSERKASVSGGNSAGSAASAGLRQHAARSPRTPSRGPERKYWRPLGSKAALEEAAVNPLCGPQNTQHRGPAGGCPLAMRRPRTPARPGSAVTAAGSAAWALGSRSLPASHPDPKRCTLPTRSRTCFRGAGLSAVGDLGPASGVIGSEAAGGQ